MKYTFLIITLLLSFVSNKAVAENKLANSSNHFAINLYQQLRAENTNENVFFSPYSIYTALGMTYAGATGDTKKEFEETLHFTSNFDVHSEIKRQNELLITSRPSLLERAKALIGEKPYQFSIANALWVKPDFPIEAPFKETLAEQYDSESLNELSVDVINNWVAENTGDKITDLLKPSDIHEATVTVLTNAAYFLGYWQQRFDEADTKSQPFYGFNAEQAMPLMHQTLEMHYSETDQYQSVSLDYENSSFAMAVILPKEKSEEAFSTLETALNASFVSELLNKQTQQEVQLYLPRFEMKIPTRLKSPLSQLGMPRSFTPQARFCGIYAGCESNPIWIEDVVHQAFIKVDEAGTEAAAATAVLMVQEVASIPMSKHFRADRPFIYFIYDKKSGVILFMGSMLNAA